MELTFELRGLDCPNCAAKIERELLKIEGISKADVDLMSQKIRITAQENKESDAIQKAVCSLVKSVEPDVEIFPGQKADAGHGAEKEKAPRRLIFGGIFALAAIVFFYAGVFPKGVNLALLIAAYAMMGYDVLWNAARNIFRGAIFDENFLMAIATVGALGIGEYPEAVAVMLFYQIGEYFQNRAVGKSRLAIASLLEIRPETARVIRNGEQKEISPKDILPGEIILVKPGERIPLDGEVVNGESMLDTRALTGESVPRKIHCGERALSGAINESQALTIKVTSGYADSTVSKIIELAQNAGQRKTKAENFITKFARYYTPAVVISACLIALFGPVISGDPWTEWLKRSFVFLVISCPCALVISIPLTFFSAIGAASRRGILVKGSNYLEALNDVGTVVFDKTGTLTQGAFEVTHIFPAQGEDEASLLHCAALAESMSNHPIAKSILRAAGGDSEKFVGESRAIQVEEISGHGVKMQWLSHDYLVGNARLMEKEHVRFTACEAPGTIVYVAKDGQYLGCIVISDILKPNARQALCDLKNLGIRQTVMLTGDMDAPAGAVAKTLNLDQYFSNLMPAAKVAKVDALSRALSGKSKLAFVGDGINDAPVLSRADIGIAMGGIGSDAAIEAADIVLMTDDLEKLPTAIRIAKNTRTVALQNISVVIAVKIVCLILGALSIVGMWTAVFADVGVMVLAVLNSMRLLKADTPTIKR